MWQAIKTLRQMWASDMPIDKLQASLAEMRTRVPVPVFWLLGRTQTGKTSIIRYLTKADDAEIGNGFRSCTRFSREYDFPNSEVPLMSFLDTRGLDEPGYNPREDIEKFGQSTHVLLLTVKVTDHAQESLIEHLKQIRAANPARPVMLVLTCLHEAYPGKQHPHPWSFTDTLFPANAPEDLLKCIAIQQERFRDLVTDIIPIDLTKPGEGFTEPEYGGEELKRAILRCLPKAYRQTLLTLDAATSELKDLYLKHAMPIITGYATLAGTVGAVPIPFVDLLILPGVQSRMVMHLAKLYGQELTGKRFLEVAGSMGLGMLTRHAARQVAKVIPIVGSVAGAALAGASTFALGRAFCFYYQSVHEGHVPDPAKLREYFEVQLQAAEKFWK